MMDFNGSKYAFFKNFLSNERKEGQSDGFYWVFVLFFNLNKGKREGSIKWETFGTVMQQKKDIVISGIHGIIAAVTSTPEELAQEQPQPKQSSISLPSCPTGHLPPVELPPNRFQSLEEPMSYAAAWITLQNYVPEENKFDYMPVIVLHAQPAWKSSTALEHKFLISKFKEIVKKNGCFGEFGFYVVAWLQQRQ
ncbi:hypothetical protein BDA99DRAFT_534087 [Phascolomyces articulosus]|uniref:Uncharacterized protein n=1 Tax=Phascolomyces articulosus TaxID=60185 RepID=A0AAD5PHA7_9FUNG|nr:hypothetical protein BDA99DRAFT_534087 [Phascolomyces articulosus]